MIDVHEKLSQTCEAINKDGFYVGFSNELHYDELHDSCSSEHTYESLHDEATRMSRMFKWIDNAISGPFSTTNPYGCHSFLFKVTPGIFTAYPIFHGNGLSRFFDVESRNDCIFDCIVIVSHKIKQLSILYVFSCPRNSHFAMLMNNTRCYELKEAFGKDYNIINSLRCPLQPNRLHCHYSTAFKMPDYMMQPYEICLNIEDHFQNEIFFQHAYVANSIAYLNDDIVESNKSIAQLEKRILSDKEQIEQLRKSNDKFETDLYMSRIQWDLVNA